MNTCRLRQYTDEIIENTGVVTEFRFINPHARIYLEVTNENGETEIWMAEGDAAPELTVEYPQSPTDSLIEAGSVWHYLEGVDSPEAGVTR